MLRGRNSVLIVIVIASAGGATIASSAASTPAGSGLPYSNASSQKVQPQPPPGSCHAGGRGRFSEPDARCTPGARNPAVKQATIARTICRTGYTKQIRPPERITNVEKTASMAAYGDTQPKSHDEYDHPLSGRRCVGAVVLPARSLVDMSEREL
jgi:hypothetical protein